MKIVDCTNTLAWENQVRRQLMNYGECRLINYDDREHGDAIQSILRSYPAFGFATGTNDPTVRDFYYKTSKAGLFP